MTDLSDDVDSLDDEEFEDILSQYNIPDGVDFSQMDDPFEWGTQNMDKFNFDDADDVSVDTLDFAKKIQAEQFAIDNGLAQVDDFINQDAVDSMSARGGQLIDIPAVDPDTRKGTDGLTITEKAERNKFQLKFRALKDALLKPRVKNYMDVIDKVDEEDIPEGVEFEETVRMTAAEVEQQAKAQRQWAETMSNSRATQVREQDFNPDDINYYTEFMAEEAPEKKPVSAKMRKLGLGLYDTIDGFVKSEDAMDEAPKSVNYGV